MKTIFHREYDLSNFSRAITFTLALNQIKSIFLLRTNYSPGSIYCGSGIQSLKLPAELLQILASSYAQLSRSSTASICSGLAAYAASFLQLYTEYCQYSRKKQFQRNLTRIFDTLPIPLDLAFRISNTYHSAKRKLDVSIIRTTRENSYSSSK